MPKWKTYKTLLNKQNTINEPTKPNKNKHTDLEKGVAVTRKEGRDRNEMAKRTQPYAGDWKLNFW